jgi:hypothetical protein
MLVPFLVVLAALVLIPTLLWGFAGPCWAEPPSATTSLRDRNKRCAGQPDFPARNP